MKCLLQNSIKFKIKSLLITAKTIRIAYSLNDHLAKKKFKN